ncbi:hypothetical protein XELAEV_18017639mg [Xenopus laevis]|uniref:Uncharacterized protein n=1 Tax=Xenopus laevis TaxID=8355 RepID=A0A974DDQ9_XENLA|nr:hypothetical protein XELAEV_18017639mg [Xenopus laevis]
MFRSKSTYKAMWQTLQILIYCVGQEVKYIVLLFSYRVSLARFHLLLIFAELFRRSHFISFKKHYARYFCLM